ncbi:hypothetical protein HMI55_000959 [Coelomomyces lativittatus]|nr:hypothetical protein HMI55_000959 [Coelomomyces lativittatus]
MDFLIVSFRFLLLLTSSPALISVNAAGVQTSKPLCFLYEKNEFKFGPLKVETQFGTQIIFVCSSVRIFLGYFESALDIQTHSGELTDNDFAKNLNNNQHFVQKKHHTIKSCLMSVKKYISEIVIATLCNFKEGSCSFEGSTDSAEQSYTDRLIFSAFTTLPLFPSSWNPNIFNHCDHNSVSCVVEVIRNTRPNREIDHSPGSGSNLQNIRPTSGIEETSGISSILQPTFHHFGILTKAFQAVTSLIFFVTSTFFI